MQSLRFSFVVLTVFLSTSLITTAQICYLAEGQGVSGSADLFEVDIATGAVLATTPLTSTTSEVAGIYGMARNPLDDVIYALYDAGSGIRRLGTLDPSSGVLTEIGSISYIMESMAFGNDGTCYAMTAANDDTPSRLVVVDLESAALEFVADLSDSGAFGQALGVDPDGDGTLYRLEGGGNEDFGSLFHFWQTLNTDSYQVDASVLLVDPDWSDEPYTYALCSTGPGTFLFTDDDQLYDLNTAGQRSNPRVLLLDGEITGIVLKNGEDNTVVGCLDPEACNFNDQANLDNGDCVYPPVDEPCAACSGETNGQGIVVILDEDQDTVCDEDDLCAGLDDTLLATTEDLNDDGIVDCEDLQISSSVPNRSSFDWFVYPNPTSDQLHVVTNSSLAHPAQVYVTSVLGHRILVDFSNTPQGVILDLHSLAAGSYVVHVQGDHTAATLRFLKR